MFDRKVDTDMDIAVPDISLDLAKGIELFAPFGEGNPEPVFKLDRAQPVGTATSVASTCQYLPTCILFFL